MLSSDGIDARKKTQQLSNSTVLVSQIMGQGAGNTLNRLQTAALGTSVDDVQQLQEQNLDRDGDQDIEEE